MWEIVEHRTVHRALAKLPLEIRKRYEKWKDIASISGPEGLRAIKGFHDNDKYRVIYQLQEHRVLILVRKVTAHDYRKR